MNACTKAPSRVYIHTDSIAQLPLKSYSPAQQQAMQSALSYLQQHHISGNKEVHYAFHDYLLLRDIIRRLQHQTKPDQVTPKP
jgi:hypothetical protein